MQTALVFTWRISTVSWRRYKKMAKATGFSFQAARALVYPPSVTQGDDVRSAGNPREGSATSAVRILIVEDEMFVAMDAEAILRSAGHEVVAIAASADEAVAKTAQLSPELVLVDIRLIGSRDGIDAAHEIGEKFNVPVIFVTANVDPVTHARAMQVRPLAIISKPFTPTTLLDGVSNFSRT